MKIRLIKDGVTFDTSILDIGAETIVDKASGLRLIKDGWAELIEEINEENPEDELPTVEEMTKTLDDLYKAADLKAKAKELGVEFDAKATKPEVITAVIEAGKYVDFV